MQSESIAPELETINRNDIAPEGEQIEKKKKGNSGGKGKKGKGRNWTKEETNLFVELLVEYNFVQTLETKALKRSANLGVFQELVPFFKPAVEEESFVALNESANFTRKGKVIPYTPLHYDATVFQSKYKDLKVKWRAITLAARNGSGEEGAQDEIWYKLLNPILSETNGDLSLIVNGANDLQDDDGYNLLADDGAENDEEKEEEEPAKKKLKVGKVSAPRIRTQSQGIAVLGKNLTEFGKQQTKILEDAALRANERHESYLQFMAEQRALDREHEMAMFRMMMEQRNAPQQPTKIIRPPMNLVSTPASFGSAFIPPSTSPIPNQQEQYFPNMSLPNNSGSSSSSSDSRYFSFN